MDNIDKLRAAIPQDIQDFLDRLNHQGDFFLVGGCVRDALLGRTPKDFDIVTTTPDAPALGWMAQIGKSFPVWTTVVGDHVIEIAAARTETKTAPGHGGFEVQVTPDIMKDLQRRDLTINTFCWDGGDQLFGCDMFAFDDLHDRVLRHVSPAFAEDPLRVFRAARFAAQLGFRVAMDTLCLMVSLGDELHTLPPDRVRDEMTKAFRGEFPENFFRVLDLGGCLDFWFPELQALQGCNHSELHHPEGDAFEHTMWVIRKCKELGGDDLAMLCALGHDFGKALTPVEIRPRYHNHEGLGVEPIRVFCDRLGFGDTTRSAMSKVSKLHMHMHKITELRPTTLCDMLGNLSRGILGVDTFALVCNSDHCGRGDANWDLPYPQRDYINGAMGVFKATKVDPAMLEKHKGKVDVIKSNILQTKAAALKKFKKEFLG